VPVAATLNVTDPPVHADWATGPVVMAGPAITVNVTVPLLTDPQAFVTRTS